MNKKERKILTTLFWRVEKAKSEHHILYIVWWTLSHLLKGQLSAAATIAESGKLTV